MLWKQGGGEQSSFVQQFIADALSFLIEVLFLSFSRSLFHESQDCYRVVLTDRVTIAMTPAPCYTSCVVEGGDGFGVATALIRGPWTCHFTSLYLYFPSCPTDESVRSSAQGLSLASCRSTLRAEGVTAACVDISELALI